MSTVTAMIHLLSYYHVQINHDHGVNGTFYKQTSANDIPYFVEISAFHFFQDDVAYFSFPFHFEVFYKNDNLDEDEKGLYVDQLAFNIE